MLSIGEEVPAHVHVQLDGGIRHGSEVVKAMEPGAAAVLMGRRYSCGVAAGGPAGVHDVQANLPAQMGSVLALPGQQCVADLDAAILAPPPG